MFIDISKFRCNCFTYVINYLYDIKRKWTEKEEPPYKEETDYVLIDD